MQMCGGQPNYLFASNMPYAVPTESETGVVVIRAPIAPPVGTMAVDKTGELLVATQHILPATATDLLTVIVNGARGTSEAPLGHPDAEGVGYAVGLPLGRGRPVEGRFRPLEGPLWRGSQGVRQRNHREPGRCRRKLGTNRGTGRGRDRAKNGYVLCIRMW